MIFKIKNPYIKIPIVGLCMILIYGVFITSIVVLLSTPFYRINHDTTPSIQQFQIMLMVFALVSIGISFALQSLIGLFNLIGTGVVIAINVATFDLVIMQLDFVWIIVLQLLHAIWFIKHLQRQDKQHTKVVEVS